MQQSSGLGVITGLVLIGCQFITPALPATPYPPTDAPATDAPATDAPATDAPATDAPVTAAPASPGPIATPATATDAPATDAPATDAPATAAPARDAPATAAPASPGPIATPANATDASATDPTTDAPATTTVSSCNVNLVATVSTQTFRTPNYPANYPNNMDCYVSISAPTNHVINLGSTAFVMESQTYCMYDYAAVYDGSSTSASLLGQYCGTSFPTTVQSASNAMYVKFVSDYSTSYSGAVMTYVAVDNAYPACKAAFSSHTATSTVQTISVGTPYTNNLDSYFLILNPGGADLIFQLTAMDVELSSGCLYDRIRIYNGGCKSFTTLSDHCGSFLKRWELTGTEYLIHFHSDGSVTEDGFTMQYYLGTANTGAPTTTTTTVGPPLAVEVNLVNEVLVNYTSSNLPRRDLATAITSTVNMYIVGINGLDEVEQKLTTTMLFEITWKDDFMGWPTTKKLGISKVLIPQNDLWKPDFALINGFEKITAMGASFMFVVVESDGSCTWKPYQIMDSVCQVDMSDYPYDTQTCQLKFSTWGSSSSEVVTNIGERGIEKHSSFVENSEWTLLSISQASETVDGQVTAVFSLVLKRNHAFVVFYVAVPIIMLSFLNAFTFALPLASGEKSGYAITVFLSFVVYVIVTFQKMPENSDTLSLFAMFVLIMTCISAISVMLVTVELRMIVLQTNSVRLLPCAKSFTRAVINIQNKIMCIKDETAAINDLKRQLEDYGIIDEADNGDDIGWSDFSSALDFVCFWILLIFSILATLVIMSFLSVQ